MVYTIYAYMIIVLYDESCAVYKRKAPICHCWSK